MSSIQNISHSAAEGTFFDPAIEFERWIESLPAPDVAPELFIKIIAHMFGDSFIGNSSLEGLPLREAARFLLLALQAKEKENFIYSFPQRDEAIALLGEILYWEEKIIEAKRSPDLEEKLTQIADEIIAKQQAQGSVILPGGWLDLAGGHSMLYRSKKQPKDYSFTVMNTGDGHQYHIKKLFDTKLKHLFCRTKKGIKEHLMTSSKFFVRLLGYRSFMPAKSIQAFSADALYPFIEDMLGGKLQEEEMYISKQQSGTCSWKVLMILLRSLVTVGEYRHFKEELLLPHLGIWYRKCTQEPYHESSMHLLKNSAARFKKCIEKNRAPTWLEDYLFQRIEQLPDYYSFTTTPRTLPPLPPRVPCKLEDASIVVRQYLLTPPPFYTPEELHSQDALFTGLKSYVEYGYKLYKEQRLGLLRDFMGQAFDTLPAVGKESVWVHIPKEQIDTFIIMVFEFSLLYAEAAPHSCDCVVNRLYLFRMLEVLVQRQILLETEEELLPNSLGPLARKFAESCSLKDVRAALRLKELLSVADEGPTVLGEFSCQKKEQLEIWFSKHEKRVPCALAFLDAYLEKKGTLAHTRTSDPNYYMHAFTEYRYLPESIMRLQWQFFSMVCGASLIDNRVIFNRIIFTLDDAASKRDELRFKVEVKSKKATTPITMPQAFFESALKPVYQDTFSSEEKRFLAVCTSAPHVSIHNLLDYFEADPKRLLREDMRKMCVEQLVRFDIESTRTLLTQELVFDRENRCLNRIKALLHTLYDIAEQEESLDLFLFILDIEQIVFDHLAELRKESDFSSIFTDTAMQKLFTTHFLEKEGLLFAYRLAWYKRNNVAFSDYWKDFLMMLILHAVHPTLTLGAVPLCYERMLHETRLRKMIEDHPEVIPSLVREANLPVDATFDLTTGTVWYDKEPYVAIQHLVKECAGYKATVSGLEEPDFLPDGRNFKSKSLGVSIRSSGAQFAFSITGHTLLKKLGDFAPKLQKEVAIDTEYLYIEPHLQQFDFPFTSHFPYFLHSRFERYRSLEKASPHLVLFDPNKKSCYRVAALERGYGVQDLASGYDLRVVSQAALLQPYIARIAEIEREEYVHFWVDRKGTPRVLEFPRHGLSFDIATTPDSGLSFWSKEHPGYFWDCYSDRYVPQVPGMLFLQNVEGKSLLLVPDLPWQKEQEAGEPYSRKVHFILPIAYEDTIRYIECLQTAEAKGKIRLARLHAVVGNYEASRELLSVCFQNRAYSAEEEAEFIELFNEKRTPSPHHIAIKMHALWLAIESYRAQKYLPWFVKVIDELHVSYTRNLPNISRKFLLPTQCESVVARCLTKDALKSVRTHFLTGKSAVQLSAKKIGKKWSVDDLPQVLLSLQEVPTLDFRASYHPHVAIEQVFHALLRRLLVAQGQGDKAEIMSVMVQSHYFKERNPSCRETIMLIAKKALADAPLFTPTDEELARYMEETPIASVISTLQKTLDDNDKVLRKARRSSLAPRVKEIMPSLQPLGIDYTKLDRLEEAKLEVDRCFL